MTRLALCAALLAALACGFDAQVDIGPGESAGPGASVDAGQPGEGEGEGEGEEPDPMPEPCGDGAVDGDEECDDGNLDGDDGCSASCSIEPGYTCSASDCDPVVGIEVGQPYHPVGAAFGLNEIAVADCPEGTLVGFAGEVNPTLGLLGIRGICADLEIEDGELSWEESSMTPLVGSLASSLESTICERDEALVGMKLSRIGVDIEGVAAICAKVSIVGGELVLGSPVTREQVGNDGVAKLEALCDPGAIAADRLAGDADPTGFGALGMRCGVPQLITD